MTKSNFTSALFFLLLIGKAAAFLVGPCTQCSLQPSRVATSTSLTATAADINPSTTPSGLDMKGIFEKLKMDVYDLDSGAVGIDSKDPQFAIEILKTTLPRGPLGLELVEAASGRGGGIVMVAGCVEGSAAATSESFRAGDFLTFVGNEPPAGIMSRVEGFDFEATVAILSEALTNGKGNSVTVVSKRLVKREPVRVTFVTPKEGGTAADKQQWNEEGVVLDVLSGSNLRKEMIRKSIPVYDPRAKRYDQPYVTGNCGGEGICGTCFVEVLEGAELLNPPDYIENLVLKKFPIRWRLSCKTIIGKDNAKDGKVKVRAVPTSAFVEENKRR